MGYTPVAVFSLSYVQVVVISHCHWSLTHLYRHVSNLKGCYLSWMAVYPVTRIDNHILQAGYFKFRKKLGTCHLGLCTFQIRVLNNDEFLMTMLKPDNLAGSLIFHGIRCFARTGVAGCDLCRNAPYLPHQLCVSWHRSPTEKINPFMDPPSVGGAPGQNATGRSPPPHAEMNCNRSLGLLL